MGIQWRQLQYQPLLVATKVLGDSSRVDPTLLRSAPPSLQLVPVAGGNRLVLVPSAGTQLAEVLWLALTVEALALTARLVQSRLTVRQVSGLSAS